jgi:hypothetical protein
VELARESAQWQDLSKIPYLVTVLKGRRWLNDPPPRAKPVNGDGTHVGEGTKEDDPRDWPDWKWQLFEQVNGPEAVARIREEVGL